MFDDIELLAGLGPGSRVVEIGPGTGQASLALAERGYRLTCVELGEGLAAIARRRLAAYPAVDVVTADFERWRPAVAGVDAVVAFTAFHWLDPERRFAHAASLLRPGGALAIVETEHVLPADGDGFFAEVQQDYAALRATDNHDDGPPLPPGRVADLAPELAASGLFAPAQVRRHVWDVDYAADEYLAVLSTYSGHRVLDPELRAQLFGRIRRRIEARPGQVVRKSYLALVNVARLA